MKLDIKIDEFDKYVRWTRDHMARAGRLMLEIHAKLQPLNLEGYVSALDGWSDWPVVVWLQDKKLPIEYTCGLVAEIERTLEMEKEFTVSTYSDVGRVTYEGRYKDHRLVVFHFPKDTCVWVETGEVEIVRKKKVVCA